MIERSLVNYRMMLDVGLRTKDLGLSDLGCRTQDFQK